MSALASEPVQALQQWFFKSALPLWWESGADRTQGGFFEKLDDACAPIHEPRRARLVSRQIYAYAIAIELGWTGPGHDAIHHGLDFLNKHLLRADGSVVPSVNPNGTIVRGAYDLYDYAFVLFGLAAAARVLNNPAIPAMADRIRGRMLTNCKHAGGGFEESVPPSLPLKANPHMHLLEAFLAWEAVPGVKAAPWRTLSDDVATLAVRHFVDPASGAIWEFYGHDWTALPQAEGNLIEPGHQFEWAWLLHNLDRKRGSDRHAGIINRLLQIGEVHGTDPGRGVTMNGLAGDLSVTDAGARLWPQTERIKAWHAAGDPVRRDAAITSLMRYFEGKAAGLWWETMRPDGSFDPEPARASSLYHIACAVHTLRT